MTYERCGPKIQFTFLAFSRSGCFVDCLSKVCSECAEQVNDEHCRNELRRSVFLDVLVIKILGDFNIRD